ncbi:MULTISPECIES: nickel/cobalt transporter [unclassified Aureimonas]|uniref:nickel/cobalt transporter n=1 Tax=unclassified Aureimonas TaxID=2615206 RepID=UPI0006F59CA1|nr:MULTISPECIES: nickel/cobalt transporter [unclassified Aureimonas]KQT66193.1 hypothetical protein ASG62_19330 [Aureimonas sp. Leaf427]KQT72381.1 hypothetical protein ASG54_03700 [Aureimonas sp. Leaf460]
MRLTRLSPTVLVLLLAGLCLLAGPEAALAKSSLGIGTAEVVVQPSGPFAGLFIEINAIQRSFFTELRQALVALKGGPHGLIVLVGLSFAYGVFHAAGPGHGKAVISSYVLANEVQLRRGILLSFVSALLQALTALLAVGLGWFVLRGTSVKLTDATNWLEIASYALIAVFGGWLLAKKLARLVSRRSSRLSLGFAPSGLAFAAAGTAGGTAEDADRPARGASSLMRPASGGMAASVCEGDEEDCDCGQAHMPDPRRLSSERLSIGTATSAVVAVGLRPCSGAIVVLTFALLNGLYLGGVLSVLAMALGTAITVSAIAAVAVFAKGFAMRLGRAGGTPRGVMETVEILGAALVLLFGLALLGGALV